MFGLAATIGQAQAGGFAVESQNMRSLGHANAGSQAQFMSPGNLYYNPASIAGTDSSTLAISMSLLFPDADFSNANGTVLGTVPIAGASSGDEIISTTFLPSFSYARPFGKDFIFGLALYAPYGFDSNYDQDSIPRYYALESKVVSAVVEPVLAYQLNENWTVAIAGKMQYYKVDASGAIDAAGIATALTIPGFVPSTDDVYYQFEGDAIDFGYALGVIGNISPSVTIGASYSSSIDHDIEGEAQFDISQSGAGQLLNLNGLFAATSFTTAITTPFVWQAGIDIQASDQTNLLASISHSGWSDFTGFALDFANAAQPDEIVQQDWSDTTSYSLGIRHQLHNDVTLSGGFMSDNSPVNDQYASPMIPDSDRNWYTVGIDRPLNDKLHLSGSLAYIKNESRQINLSQADTGNFFRGDLQMRIDSKSVLGGVTIEYEY
ncbi:MAG: OmpP1/FadL family transporter [bacterium]